jgi:hypothetical protein
LLLGGQAGAQSIFDFDEPTTRPSTGGATVPQQPEIDLRPGPITPPPDRFYLFPPVPWEDATRGVLRLTTPSPIVPGAPNKPPAVAADLGELPPIQPGSVQALRRRYAALITDQQVKDFETVYGDDERRAAGKPAELMLLMGTFKGAAKDVTDQPDLQRYLLLRAFVAARQAGASEGTLLEIARQLRPTLGKEIPSELLQRAELEGALADAVIEAKRKGQMAGTLQIRAAAAGKAFYEVANWQERHCYLPEATEMLARAEYYGRAGNVEECLRFCGLLRTFVLDWTRIRAEFLEKYHAYRAAPEDPKANADYARVLMVASIGVPWVAQQPLMKSGDPVLKAVGQAAAIRDPAARSGAVGLSLLPLIGAASGKEKAIFARIALAHLDQFVKSGRTSDSNFTKGRLYLTRLKTAYPEAAEAMAAAGGGGGANGAGNPVFAETAARRVVYVLDGSGSMMNKFDVLRTAVDKAVAELKPTQLFNVVIMHEDEGVPFNKQAIPATDANKKLFSAYMKRTQPHGSSDPIPALRFAFAQNPDAIYFLTDGDFPNNNLVIFEMRRLNAANRTKVHTIAFMDRGEEYERVLKVISEQNGGTFRFISDVDVANLK